MRILGIDPGTRVVGWGLLASEETGPPRYLASGTWSLGRQKPLADRLHQLHRHLSECLTKWRPDRVALEAAFFGKNARSALRLGEARGVVMVTAAMFKISLLEIPPAQVKRRVAGAGAASKEQIAYWVSRQLELSDDTCSSSDESDALAVALCAHFESRLQGDPVVEPGPGKGRRLPPGAHFQ